MKTQTFTYMETYQDMLPLSKSMVPASVLQYPAIVLIFQA